MLVFVVAQTSLATYCLWGLIGIGPCISFKDLLSVSFNSNSYKILKKEQIFIDKKSMENILTMLPDRKLRKKQTKYFCTRVRHVQIKIKT